MFINDFFLVAFSCTGTRISEGSRSSVSVEVGAPAGSRRRLPQFPDGSRCGDPQEGAAGRQ